MKSAAQWPSSPYINVPICTYTSDQERPVIATDGVGGAIVVWEDSRYSRSIYAQRVNAEGYLQWPEDGLQLSTLGFSRNPSIISDGDEGVIVTWQNPYYDKILAQRVNGLGNCLWLLGGIDICSISGLSFVLPKIVSDGSDGAIIAWFDNRNNGEWYIFAQRIDADGNIQWQTNGIQICKSSDDRNHEMTSDGSGGAIIVWEDLRGEDYDLYTQRVNHEGIIQWEVEGVAVCQAEGDQYCPKLIADGSGGAIITWEDYRNGYYDDIYAQRVDANGNLLWQNNGLVICNATDLQARPQIISDDNNGAIITWFDFRPSSLCDIYAQRISPTGVKLWNTNGAPVSTISGGQYDPVLVSDGDLTP